MKILGVEKFPLLDYYMKAIRVQLELAVPVWHSGLTLQEENNLERVQKVALKIILKDQYKNYNTYSYFSILLTRMENTDN